MANKIATIICLLFASKIPDADLFSVTPQNTVVYFGDDTQLECSFQETTANKAWFFESTRITLGETVEESKEHYKIIIEGEAYNLQVHNSTSSLSGMYSCESQRLKNITSCAHLYVIGQSPACSVYPNSTVIENHKRVFTCTMDLADKAPGNLVWLKWGKVFYRGAGKNTTWETNLDKSDNGAEFDCQFHHETLPRSRWSTLSCGYKILMNVQYGPSVFIETIDGSTIVEGESVTANCRLNDANPKDRIEVNWKSPNGRSISQNEILLLKSLTRSDSGEYICYMSNVFYNGEKGTGKASINVDVQYMSSINMTVIPETHIIHGNNVTFRCKSENGNPNPSLMTLSKGKKRIISVEETNLLHTINGVKGSDSGIYKCVAFTTFHDGSQKSCYAEQKLDIQYSPKHVRTNANYTASINDEVEMVCDMIGFPAPTLTWFDSQGDIISRNSKTRKITVRMQGKKVTSTLSIAVVDESYYGTYTCKAANGILPNCFQYMKIVGRDIATLEPTLDTVKVVSILILGVLAVLVLLLIIIYKKCCNSCMDNLGY